MSRLHPVLLLPNLPVRSVRVYRRLKATEEEHVTSNDRSWSTSFITLITLSELHLTGGAAPHQRIYLNNPSVKSSN